MFFYNLIIQPIKLLLEICYLFFYEITASPGLSIIALSFLVTLCCLPLYVIAESLQEKERIVQKNMAYGVKRIKETFKGDEQYMILSTFYKQNHYHPMMALRASLGLLIQIPFFISAYTFLSHLTSLNGKDFLFIKDLGKPDSLFFIKSFGVNILPILMTLINCISSVIYTKGHSTKEKIQVYVTALVFLVLLYNSPAGLVVYWTMNNVLSLVKNIFYKLKNPLKTLYFISVFFSILGIISAIFILDVRFELKAIFVLVCIFIVLIPFWLKIFNLFINHFLQDLSNNTKVCTAVFLCSTILLALLVGLYDPSMLISSEPETFSYVDSYKSPYIFLITPFIQAIGLFIFWPACFYALFSKKIKLTLSFLTAFCAIYGLINNFIFSGNYGTMTSHLLFMASPIFFISVKATVINFLLALFLFLTITFVLSKKASPLIPVLIIVIIALLGTSLVNIKIINKHFTSIKPANKDVSIEPIFHLSKTGKNVIVIMEDRCCMPYVQPVFDECPELLEKFSGFTFYPNTISFAPMTMMGSPGLYGGYEYTPLEINKRSDKTLQQKHNEALLTLPVIFYNAGFSVTVADLPYENYSEPPQTAMYKDYPFINRVSGVGAYSDLYYSRHPEVTKKSITSTLIKRNFLIFGIFKIFPPCLRRLIYYKEWWNSSIKTNNLSTFVDSYSELDFLPELVDSNSQKDSFVTFVNLLPHEPLLCQAPDYIPMDNVTNLGTSPYAMDSQFHCMVSTFKLLGKFFDYLKKENLYDNTRIIIVSDHGASDQDLGILKNEENNFPFYKEEVTATLLVKDFNSSDSFKIDWTFMTNADTPSIACKDIVSNAKNPFTGNSLQVEDKNKYAKIVYPEPESTRNRFHTAFNIKEWWAVHDDIYLPENWKHETPDSK